MKDDVHEFHNCLGVLSLEVQPINRQVVKDMASWVVARTKVARKLAVICLSVVYSCSLLDISHVVNSVSIGNFRHVR